MKDRNTDGSRKSFGVYTVYRSAFNFQCQEQDYTVPVKWKKKMSLWLTGTKKKDALAKKEGKKKAQVGKRPMPVSLHSELLSLMQKDGTKQGK